MPLTIAEAAAALRAGQLTSVELTTLAFERADRVDAELGVYLSRFDERALEAAAIADAELAHGLDRGALHGVPVGVKDIVSTLDGPTTAQSLVLDPEWGERQGDAPVIARLRAAGVVIVGKTTTMEFAVGLPDPEKPFPLPRNPWDLRAWAGGSSSGNGSGLAAGFFLGAVGTDTGGSVRVPAAFCGVSGLQPTFGLVPKSGCVPFGPSTDVIGPMARSAQDCAEMLAAMAGVEASDPCTFDAPVPAYAALLGGSVEGLRLGVDRSIWSDLKGIDPVVADVFDAALAVLVDAGAEIVSLMIPHYQILQDTNWSSRYEAFAYHRRNLQTRWNDYGAATRIALTRGALISADEYSRLQRIRRVGRNAILQTFESVDALLSPTAVQAAPPVDGLELASYAENLLTPVWNIVGFPALSIPMGFNGAGLPLGLQIVTKPLSDALTLRIGHAYQQLTDWHLQTPPLAFDAAAQTATR